MIDRIKKPFVQLLIFAITFSPLGIIKAQAADPTIDLANNYEIAVAGANLDSAVDSVGNTYVVYERSGNIYIVKNRSSEELVGTGTNPTIALDDTNTPHIAYLSLGSIIYELFDGDWGNEVNIGIGTSASYVDMDVDSNGKAHIFMRAHYYSDNYNWIDLLYVSNINGPFELVKGWNGDRDYSSSGSWGGYYYDTHPISIAIDGNDNYHLLFWHASVWVWYADRDWSYSLQYHTNVTGASKNLGGNYTLYKNSLTVDALGRANVVYGSTKHGLISSGVWLESDISSASKPTIASNSSAIAIAYVGSGVNFYENNGDSYGETIQIDPLGDNPTVSLNDTNRFVYYTKSGKIYLATDKVIYNNPVITGVEADGIYNTSKEISWDHGDGTLNGNDVASPITVTDDGSYNITVVNNEGKFASVDFSIDKTAPTITIDGYNTSPTNQDITVTASTNEGTLNAISHTFTQNGSFTFTATDVAGNETTETVVISNIDKVSPVIEIGIYSTTPTNQDITVTASTNEGTLNSDSHTFIGNGSFDFVASDAAGNITTYTVTISNIDKVAPTITIDPYSSSWTKEDITVNASTDEGTLNATSHTFTENGSFDFVSTDAAGNETTNKVTISNIDKTKPVDTAILSLDGDEHVRGSLLLQASATDNESGIEKVEFSTTSGKIGEDDTTPFEFDWDTTSTSDGTLDIWVTAYDKAGNATSSRPTTITVDNTAPVVTIGEYSTTPTNQDITVTASTNEGTLNATSHTFTENGTFTFIATDPAGNVTESTVTITNIDKVGPVITIGEYNTLPTNQDITITASVTEGTLNVTSYTFTENGSFEFVATDSLGNQTKKLIEITNIDKAPPTGSITSLSSNSPIKSIVTLIADIEDDGSGIEKVEFYHASTVTLIGKATAYPFTIDWDTSKVGDGEHKVWTIAYDKAGNITTSNKMDVVIDNTAPIISIEPYSTDPTTGSITIYCTANEGTLNASSYTFAKNGSFEFIATDTAGNKTTKTVTISNIETASQDDAVVTTSVPDSQPLTTPREASISTLEVAATAEAASDLSESTDEKLEAGTSSPQEDTTAKIKGESDESEPNKYYIYWIILLVILGAGTSYYIAKIKKSDK